MVVGILSNGSHVIPRHFFLQSLRVNVNAYIEVLDTVVKSWIVRMSVHVLAGLDHDLNLVDSVVEWETNQQYHNIKDSFKATIADMMANINEISM